MVVISNCVGTKFESMASVGEIVKNGASIVEHRRTSSHCMNMENKPLHAYINRGSTSKKKNSTTQVVYYISRELRKIQRENFRENSWV